ncbi:MAG: methionyl-tRNA formyltransferase [Clostridia bacterium]|nr:methionyl-tRNA formyltransferase [Clostridia bacterium]
MRIVFMGTPDIAATSLKALIDSHHEVVGVFAQPDKPKGRGYVLTPPPTKVLALEHGIPVYQPETLRDGAAADILDALSPDLIAVVAYGKLLPKYVLDYPPYGCINLHASLLPKYRGAAPMQRAIMAGEAVTGVTTMYMAEGLDTGDMLLTESFPIGDEDNFEDIHDRTAAVGAALLLKTVDAAEAGTLQPIPQNDAAACYAAKIEKSECQLDFTKSVRELDCFIRGLSPIPLAFTHTPDGKLLKIVKATPTVGKGKAGEVLKTTPDGFTVACGDGALLIRTLVPEGKGRMSAADFVRGRKIGIGDILS